MPQLEEVYARFTENKRRAREIRTMLTDELAHSERYKELKDEIKTLRDEAKTIETEVRGGTQKEMEELDELKSEIQADTELLADIALNMFVNNQVVEIIDQNDVKWSPRFKVNFKRDN
jgi:hypothetical protein